MLELDRCALVVIDIQEKLAQLMYRKEALFENAQKLIRGVQILEVPIIVTEQYPKGLGPTIREIAALFPDFKPLPKVAFSCCGDEGFQRELLALDRRQILICGIETHVCVYQTAVDLLASGYEVEVVADAVSSRTADNREVALQRMRDEGAGITSTEMALFDLMKVAEGPKFKEVSKIVK
ncbi:MAG: hydrolase [Dehalococcoidia bacterium]|nr:hydrolase [Dehalococcoidia bacterium]